MHVQANIHAQILLINDYNQCKYHVRNFDAIKFLLGPVSMLSEAIIGGPIRPRYI